MTQSYDRRRRGRKTYFIQGKLTRLIKIGMAINPEARLRALQAMSPDKLILLHVVDGYRERELHYRFDIQRSHGEWFYPEEIEEYLKIILDKRSSQ